MDYEQFEALKPEEQERIFHQSPFREKGDLILHSHYPDRLAQSLSQEELYLVTREMDLEERSEIIRFANLSQLLFIGDIDCWKKDRIYSQGFIRWLETLKEADERKLLAWLLESDYETVVAGFNQVIRVLKPEWEYPSDEMLGDQPYFTLDERYFIFVQEENLETVRRAVEILFENHRGQYVAILEGILGEMEDVLEEEAFRKREMRFADRGFPDPEIAHHIYRPISEEEWKRFSLKLQEKQKNQIPEFKVPHYPLLWSSERFFIDDVLLLFQQESSEIREGIEEELAWLSNKVLACQGIDFSSEERVRQGAERVRCFLSIGLELLTQGDIGRAFQIMKERWLEMIFRWSATRLLEIRDAAFRVVQTNWEGSRQSFLEFLNPPYEFIFRGLLQPIPECYDLHIKDHPSHLRDFKNADELEKVKKATQQIARILQWLTKQSPEWLKQLDLSTENDEAPVSLFSVLGTLFIHFVLNGKTSTQPLTEKEVQIFCKESFQKNGSRKVLDFQSKENFLNQSFAKEDQELFKPLWALVFQEIEEELGRLDISRPLDMRFISSFQICKGNSKKPKSAGRPSK